MGLMDNMSDDTKDMMNDPDKRAEIEQMAKDQGISMEEAKEQFARRESNM